MKAENQWSQFHDKKHILTKKTPETLQTEKCNKIQEHHFESNMGQEFEINKLEAGGIKHYHAVQVSNHGGRGQGVTAEPELRGGLRRPFSSLEQFQIHMKLAI